MVKSKTSITIKFIVSATIGILANNIAYAQETTSSIDNMQGITRDWSINATDAETNELIRRAELILQQNIETERESAKTAAQNIISASDNNAVALPVNTSISPAAPAEMPKEQSAFIPENGVSRGFVINASILNWLLGLIAVLISAVSAYVVYTQLRHSRRAGRQASSLIAEVKDLQKNLKEWELGIHTNHLHEIASHIEAINDNVVTAKEVKSELGEVINKGISLNQKSLEILKKANREISKSLSSQVITMEQQLKNTAETEFEKINSCAQGQIDSLKSEKDSIMQLVEQKTSELKIQQNNIVSDIEKHNHQVDDKQQSTTSMIDIITNELNMLKAQNSSEKTITTNKSEQSDKSHADLLRESIARQRTAISGSSLFSNLKGTDSNDAGLKSTAEVKNINENSNNTIDRLKIDTVKTDSENQTSSTKKSLSIQKESTITTSDGIEITTRDISTNKDKVKSSQNGITNKFTDLNSKELMEKLSHAEKWHNFKVAAEICQEMARRSPEKSEVYDIWGQMLARQASTEKGQNNIILLKEAAQKMQKASLLDNSNFKIFNNWGVILKNLALSCNDNQEMEKHLALARRKFETSLSLNPQNHEALNNWGNTLMIQSRFRTGAMQESLLKSACEKFAEAVALKPDKEVALYSWGNALFRLANCKNDKETRNTLLVQAQQCWEKANSIKPGIASKELRVIRSMVPPLNNKTTKKVTDYKFKTLNSM